MRSATSDTGCQFVLKLSLRPVPHVQTACRPLVEVPPELRIESMAILQVCKSLLYVYTDARRICLPGPWVGCVHRWPWYLCTGVVLHVRYTDAPGICLRSRVARTQKVLASVYGVGVACPVHRCMSHLFTGPAYTKGCCICVQVWRSSPRSGSAHHLCTDMRLCVEVCPCSFGNTQIRVASVDFSVPDRGHRATGHRATGCSHPGPSNTARALRENRYRLRSFVEFYVEDVINQARGCSLVRTVGSEARPP